MAIGSNFLAIVGRRSCRTGMSITTSRATPGGTWSCSRRGGACSGSPASRLSRRRRPPSRGGMTGGGSRSACSIMACLSRDSGIEMSEELRMGNDGQRESIDRVLIGTEEIQGRVRELGAQIAADFAGNTGPLILVGVLRGAVVFMADLIRAIEASLTIDFI